MMVGRFAEVCRKRGLRLSAGKSNMIILNRYEGLESEVHVDGIRLEHVLFKTNQVQMEHNAVRRWHRGRMGAGAIRDRKSVV